MADGVTKSFRVLPVLDLMGGRVVRAVAGRRHEYRPVVSRLTGSCLPADVAAAVREYFGLSELYLADLDALTDAAPARDVYDDLRSRGFSLWVDAGLRRAEDAVAIEPIDRIVAGLETLAGPWELERLTERFAERVVFSLDLRDGEPLGDRAVWGERAEDAAARAVAAGVRCVIVLDLARVGLGGGTATESLCTRLAEAHPGVAVLAGGGVRGPEDLQRLRACGAAGVLVASALHDGRLQPEHLTG